MRRGRTPKRLLPRLHGRNGRPPSPLGLTVATADDVPSAQRGPTMTTAAALTSHAGAAPGVERRSLGADGGAGIVGNSWGLCACPAIFHLLSAVHRCASRHDCDCNRPLQHRARRWVLAVGAANT